MKLVVYFVVVNLCCMYVLIVSKPSVWITPFRKAMHMDVSKRKTSLHNILGFSVFCKKKEIASVQKPELCKLQT